jgi:beta-galactosidase
MTPNPLHLGTAYYPEHWPEERWPEDIRLMHKAGMTVARMGEFAWSTIEPTEGQFRFDWLDRAITALAEAGLVSVLGTPTAAPPAWLTHNQPDTLLVNADGRRAQHGGRCHYCVNSPDYHDATRRIVDAMGAHFGDNPHVIGWQLDNEYGPICYCDHCRGLFQEYLAERFGTLDALNDHWTTRYWSQTYSAWEQIPLPITGRHNPGLRLAFQRFVTASRRRFQRLQIDTLRPHLPPDVWITHNFMQWFGNYDHYEIAEDLDIASWDWYVGAGHLDYLEAGAAHDLIRGLKRKSFWLMETQPGNVDWRPANTVLHRGEMRVMAWHAVAHGADAVLYWQWRSALNGQEQYHGTLVDQSGKPRLIYGEVQQLGQEFARASSLLAGSTTPQPEVAILNSYDARWSIQWQRHHEDFDYVAHLLHYHRPFAARNIPVDIVSPYAPLDGYRLVVAPGLILVDETIVANLKAYTERGRNLMLTLRCGMKDDYNALLPSRQPGPLAELASVEVEEYYALDEPVPVIGNWFSGHSRFWAERLKLTGDIVSVAARYGPSNGWLDEQVAITVNSRNNGLVYYVGAYLDEEAQQAFIDRVILILGLKPTLKAPTGVEVRTRVSAGGEDVFIVINHTREEKSLDLPWPTREHLTETLLTNEVKLAPYGVLILTRETEESI